MNGLRKKSEEVNLLYEPAENKMVEISGPLVNVRSAPSLTAKIFGAVEKGAMFECFDTVPDLDGVDWHEIKFNGKHGYVCGKYSRLVE